MNDFDSFKRTRNPSFTKSGPGRYHMQGDGKHNDLTIKQARSGMFGKGLRNAITQKNAARLAA